MLKKGLLLIVMFLLFAGFVSGVSIDPIIEKELESKEHVSVIVKLKDEAGITGKLGISSAAKVKRSEVINEISSQGFSKNHEYSLVNAFSGEVSKEGLEALKNNPNVENIGYNYPVHSTLSDSIPLINASVVHGLTYKGLNLTGKDETVCVIDTGVNFSHSAFNSRGLKEVCYCNYSGSACCPNGDQIQLTGTVSDDNGHGTHVAGIAAANGSVIGVAPAAGIVSVKILNSAGDGDTDDLESAIEYCINNATLYNISVITMSLSTGPPNLFSSYCDGSLTTLTSLVNQAVANNISVFGATGNNANYTAIGLPSCITNVTAVSATDKNDNIASGYANRNSLTDLVAPGSSIVSTSNTGGTTTLSGTSQATPHAAGAALLLQQFKRLLDGGVLTPLSVQDTLNDTGVNIADSGSGLNFSRIDVDDALYSLDTLTIDYESGTEINNSYFNRTWIFVNVSVLNSTEVTNLTFVLFNSSGLVNQTQGLIYELNWTNLNSNSVYYFNVSVIDEISKENFTSTNVLTLDSTQPIINLDFPINDSWVNSRSFYFNFTVNEANIDNCSLYGNFSDSFTLNQTLNSSFIVNNQTNNFSLISLVDGDYFWNVLCYDKVGFSAWNPSNLTFSVDATFPSLSYTTNTPEDNSYFKTGNSVFVNVTGNDTNQVNITFRISNSSFSNYTTYSLGDQTSNRSINWTGLSSNSVYNFNVSLVDLAGNVNTTSARTVTFDNITPRVTAISTSSSGTTTVTLTLSVTTNENSVCRYKTSDDSYSGMTNMSTTGGTSHSNAQSFTSNSSGTYYVRCNDSASNVMASSNSTAWTVTVSGTTDSGDSGGGGGGGGGDDDDDFFEEDEIIEEVVEPVENKDFGKVTGGLNSAPVSIAQAPPEKLIEKLKEVFEKDIAVNGLKVVEDVSLERKFESLKSKSRVKTEFRYEGGETLKQMIVYDSVPKSFADDADKIKIEVERGTIVKVIEKDPVFMFIFKNVESNETKSIGYVVKDGLNESVLVEFSEPLLYSTDLEIPSFWKKFKDKFSEWFSGLKTLKKYKKYWWFGLIVLAALIFVTISSYFVYRMRKGLPLHVKKRGML